MQCSATSDERVVAEHRMFGLVISQWSYLRGASDQSTRVALTMNRSGAEPMRRERQWRDILGILRVSGTLLDREYLASAAIEAQVADLLERALGDSRGTH